MMRTANPALNDKAFRSSHEINLSQTGVMTLQGTVNKTLMSLGILVLTASFTWGNPDMVRWILPLSIGGLVIAIGCIFKRTWAPVLTPAYAAVEGAFLGSISWMFEMQYPGIAFQAISLTFGVLGALLLAYKSGLIPVTQNFKLGIVAATGGIFVVYLISFIARMFGAEMSFLYDSSPLSIGISFVVVIIAALNLVLDFDFIESGAESGNMPKYMEWYAAFGLMVTLVWLYLEILRLLAKLQSRD